MNNEKTYDEVKQIVHEKCIALLAKHAVEQLKQADNDWIYKYDADDEKAGASSETCKDWIEAIGSVQDEYDPYDDYIVDDMFRRELGIE